MASGGETYDVVVVGAGVLGLFTAYTMVRRGLRVLLLEQVSPLSLVLGGVAGGGGGGYFPILRVRGARRPPIFGIITNTLSIQNIRNEMYTTLL